MRIVCPECQAAYNVGPMIKNAILVCHRCDTEFDTYGNKITELSEVQQIFKTQEDTAPTFGIHDLIQSGMNSRRQHIWLWMVLVLLVLAAVGTSVRWQHWQLQSTIRGYTLQANNNAPVWDRDWRILPDSINTQWLERQDNSLVLLVEGQVENLVNTSLPLPEIQVLFVTQTGQNITHTLTITEPADMAAMLSVPFVSPAMDALPVAGLGLRGFMLLLEDVPDSTAHVVLHAIAVQRHGSKPTP